MSDEKENYYLLSDDEVATILHVLQRHEDGWCNGLDPCSPARRAVAVNSLRPQVLCWCGKPTKDFSRACSLAHVYPPVRY